MSLHRPIVQGDGIGSLLQVSTLNAMREAGVQSQESFSVDAPPDSELRRGDVAKVQNTTGGAVGELAVLGIGSPLIASSVNESEFRRFAAFKGVTPSAAHEGKFCILLQPLPGGDIGDAVFSGVVSAKVNVTDTSHEWADVKIGSTAALESRALPAGAKILGSKPTSTGVQMVYVRLGNDSFGGAGANWYRTIEAGTNTIGSDCIANFFNDTLTIKGDGHLVIVFDGPNDTITLGAASAYGQVQVSGQPTVRANSPFAPLELVAGSGVAITTTSTPLDPDQITISATGAGFGVVAVPGETDIVADGENDTLTVAAGSGITLATNPATDTLVVSNTMLSFGLVAVDGQSTVAANAGGSQLELVAGSGVTITTDATADKVTFAVDTGVTNQSLFQTISVTGQSDVVADGPADTLTLAGGEGIAITTDAASDKVTVALSQKKQTVRFTLNAALTTTDASKAATITDQYGPGENNSTTITAHNLETASSGTYVFKGASGAAGLAVWDSGTNYRIIQMECP